ncbi:MAG: bifunctional acetate--CoA ligase family protein/GNAT family N-acetyltransferase [Frankiaceae bacterium]
MAANGYPAEWEADVVLADGGTAHLRPLTPGDADRWSRFVSRLSSRTIYYRFFTEHPHLGPEVRDRYINVDHVDRVAFVALLHDEIIAVGRYDRLQATLVAEVAFVVDDPHQHRGLGSILLEHLAAAARERGLQRFEAEVLTENVKMIRVFRDAGYRIEREVEGSEMRLAFDIEPTEHSVEVMRAREHRAEFQSIARLLNPRTIAVVGASRTPGSVGHSVLRHLLEGQFPGSVYPVNPAAASVAAVHAYPSVLDIPDNVDLAVIITPEAALADVVAQCGAKQACGLIIVTETEDPTVDADLVAQARSFGLRVIGPTSMGVICTRLGINASLSPVLPRTGPVGFFSQSAPLGGALLEQAVRRGLGVSTIISAGNQAVVSSNALLQFWEEDEATDVVLLYLETVGNPRKFARLARRISWRKPVVTLTTGATDAEAALLRQAGVIRVETVSELFDVAQLLVTQPLPAGRRLAVVSDSPPLARLAVSAADSVGLACTGARLLPHATPASEYGSATEQAAGEADAVLAILVRPTGAAQRETAAAVAQVAHTSGKPVLVILMPYDGTPAALGTVPAYPSPNSAVRALARAVQYSEFRSRPPGLFAMPSPVDLTAARAAAADGRIIDLLSIYGISVEPALPVGTADEAVVAATKLGWPVALKATARNYRHRPELRGVRLDLVDEDQLRVAFDALSELPDPKLVVQHMAPPGVAVTAGIREDPIFGPLVSFGVAGEATELLGDRAYRILPLSDLDATELIRSVRAAPLLFGYRARAPVDVKALEELLLRVARLADELPTIYGADAQPDGRQVRSLELNPVIVGESGVRVLAADARFGRPVPRGDVGPRRIR